LLLGGCNSAHKSESFVTDKEIYFKNVLYVGTDEKVDKVEKQIGAIQKYSTHEQDWNTDSFSNYYSKGTKLYKIPDVDIKDAIAVEMKKNEYIKAVKMK